MGKSIQLLLIEDNEDDACLEILELTRSGFDVSYECVETEDAMREALARKKWDCIISDYSMPNFSGIDALHVYKELGLDIPFILVSGTIGEDIAVNAMKAGAHDYIMKNRLMRLVPSLERELKDCETRRKLVQAEKEKHEKDILFRHLIEKNSSIVMLVNAAGQVLFESPAIESVTGYTKEERIGRHIYDLIHPSDLERSKLMFEEVCLSREESKTIVMRSCHKNGSIKWIEVVATNFLHDPIVNAIIVNVQDITERKLDEQTIRELNENLEQKIEERTLELAEINKQLVDEINERKAIEHALSVSEGKLHAILNLAPVVISIIDKKGKIIYTSSYQNKLTDKDGKQLVGSSVFDVDSIHPADRFIFGENLKKIKKYPGSVIKTEYRGFGVNKELVWFEALAKNYIGNPSISGILVVIQEITERKKAELALVERENQLKELNGTKDKFFSIIAHDLKNPFSVLFSSIELLLMHLQKNNLDRVQAKALMIQDAAKRGYNLLQNLLEWAQTQLGTSPFKPIETELYELVSEVIASVDNIAIDKSISIFNEIDKSLIAIVDSNLLQIVMRNLITNAIKFTNKDGQVIISAKQSSQSIEVAVKDTGVGMTSEILERLFRIDTKVTTKGTNDESGTGLGLILCKEFVEKHGGKIWAESNENEGSIFRFTIPC